MVDHDEYVDAWSSASTLLEWVEAPSAILADGGDRPLWFPGGRLDPVVNLLGGQPQARPGNALIWEGEDGAQRKYSYTALREESGRLAAALLELGVKKGDEVLLYMGAIPEAVVTMLACARIGAIHIVLSPSLPSDALATRIASTSAKVVVTQDGALRHGVILPLKARADEATAATGLLEHTIVVRRCGVDVEWYTGDHWYADLLEENLLPAPTPAIYGDYDPLLIAYLSRKASRPSGYCHRALPLLVHAAAMHRALSLAATSMTWCTYDIGNIAQQVHGIYGPLLAGHSSLLYEGMLDTPATTRTWELLARYDVSTFITTPSVIRHLRRWSNGSTTSKFSSLAHVVSIGEPLADDELDWTSHAVGPDVRISDGWGQTELGGIVRLTQLAGPESSTPKAPEPRLMVLDETGQPCPVGSAGELVLEGQWPATYVPHEPTNVAPHHSKFPGVFATGDKAIRSVDGECRVLGPLDRSMNVSGQMVSVDEVLSVALQHPSVLSAEVHEYAHETRGHAVAVFVVVSEEGSPSPFEQFGEEIRQHVSSTLGGIARPQLIVFTDVLPVTSSDLHEVLDAARRINGGVLTLDFRHDRRDTSRTVVVP